MPWFRVSDDLPSKASTTRIPRPYRCAALGLWSLAGAWSAAQLTDGHIPEHMLEELSGTPDDAGWLVTAGIWNAADDGWQFVEWAPDQPLRETVLEARRKNAEKVTTWRSRNRPSGNPVTPTVTNPVTNAAVTLPPIPTQSQSQSQEKTIVQPKVERDDALEAEFDEFWIAWPRKQAKADALKAFKLARKTTDAETILAGARAYALLNVETERQFLKLPAGWLRGQRWADDQIPQSASTDEHHSKAGRNAAEYRRIYRPTKDERAFMVLEQGRQLAIQGYGLPARQSEVPPECPVHPGYPITRTSPCEACKRDALAIPEGADF